MPDRRESHNNEALGRGGETDQFVIGDDLLYQALADGGIGTWRAEFDRDSLVVDACEAELLGFNPEAREITFDDILERIHPDDVEHITRRYAESEAELGRYQHEVRIVLPDGEIRWLLARGTIYPGESGELVAAGVHIDITEQHRIEEALRESRRRLATLMSNLPGMAYRCLNDPDWTMVFVSEGCEGLCGYRAEQLVSGEVVWNELVIPDDREWLWEQAQAAIDEVRPFEVEYRIRHADGTIRWMWEQGRGVYDDGSLLGLEGFITDITARKHAEEKLHQADQRKDQFLAMLGHELRNPLTAIISSSEFLEDYDASDPALARVQRILARQSRQMKRLIDGLLDVSRIDREKVALEKTKIDLLDVVRGLLEDRAPRLSQRNLEIHVGAGHQHIWMDADPVRLGQVFDNLLMNAVEHTQKSDTVSLSARQIDDVAEVVVGDTGEGISPEFLDVIFEPFQQGPRDLARDDGGLGLGLALAKGLVELHGGEIEARSKGLGHGAEFIVRLPTSEAPQRVAPAKPAEESVCRDVLLIEDDADVAEVLTLILSRLGHGVRVASTAVEGLEMAIETPPELIFCDLGLPGISGFEVAERIRAHDGLRHLPLVALTGYGGPSVRQRALEAGFDEHVTKPVSMSEIGEVCERMCATRH